MSFQGHLTCDQAWSRLSENPRAVLVDCRTQAEWNFVGVPDLSSIGKRAVFVEWLDYPDGALNPRFVDELRAAGVEGDDEVLFCAVRGTAPRAPRRPPPPPVSDRRTTFLTGSKARSTPRGTAAVQGGGQHHCPGSRREENSRERITTGLGLARDHRCPRRDDALGILRDLRSAVPEQRIRLRVGRSRRACVHRRGPAVRLQPLRQPDGGDVRGTAPTDRGHRGLFRDGERNGRGVRRARRAAQTGQPLGRRPQPLRLVLRDL